MKEIGIEKTVFNVELTLDEIKYIAVVTQKYCGEDPNNESKEEFDIRLSLFIVASRILGLEKNDDGTVNRV